MALLSLSASVRVTRLNPFADNRDHNFEGDSTLRTELAATPAGPDPVQITDGVEWWCADGGWVGDMTPQDPLNPWGLHGTVTSAGTTNSLDADVYNPYTHGLFMVRAVDPAGVQPDEWILAQAPIAIDEETAFDGSVETRPGLLSPPPPLLPINLDEGVFIAVRGPVEAYDLVSSPVGGLVRKRTVVIAGQIVNWFNDASVLAAISAPDTIDGPIDLRISIDDATAGTPVVSESCFDAIRRTWHRNLGMGEEKGFTLQHANLVAAFLVHCPVPDSFSFGTVTLQFVWPNGSVTRSVPVSTPGVDVLHWPVELDAGQRTSFGNGLADRFNSHTLDLHQHLAYDVAILNSDFSQASFNTRISAVATGTVRATRDDVSDQPADQPSQGEANRVFMQHAHEEGDRYSVCAHILQGSAVAAGETTIAAGSDIARIGNNGSTSGAHLHLAYYRLTRFGRMRMLPMAFAMRRNASAETIIGVPAAGLLATAAPLTDADDPLVDTLDIFITTGNRNLSGTDDDVTATFAGRTFTLDNRYRDDFERGNTDRFSIPPWPGLRVSELRGGIHIHKSPDGPLGGWNLDGVKIVANGRTLLDAQGLDWWLSSAPQVGRLDWDGEIN